MKKKIDITTPYSGVSKFYFEKIIDTIIEEGQLKKKNLKILDFGCGLKFLQKKLSKKIYNYDVNPELSDLKKWDIETYDVVIFNHVIMYMSEKSLAQTIIKIKQLNNKCKIIIGVGKESMLNRIAAYLTLRFDYLKNTKMNYQKQINYINKNFLVKKKKNIYFLTEIYFCEFLL